MPVTELNHYLLRTHDLERARRFYCDALGFEVMPRPGFPFPGYWLGTGGNIQVHLAPDGIANADVYYLGTTPASARDNTGVVDHIAFLATGAEDFVERFAASGLPTRKRFLRAFRLFQLFVKDPDGLTIELNFHGIEGDPPWCAGGEDYAAMPEGRGDVCTDDHHGDRDG